LTERRRQANKTRLAVFNYLRNKPQLLFLLAIFLLYGWYHWFTGGSMKTGEEYKRNEKLPTIVIVIPFIESQVERILENLELWNSEVPPCEPKNVRTTPLPFTFSLIFLANMAPSLEKLKTLNSKRLIVPDCVDSTVFLSADLSEEQDKRANFMDTTGSNFMFYRGFEILKQYNFDYMFWYEPDVVPIRPYWLDHIYMNVIQEGKLDFLILGSHQHADKSLYLFSSWKKWQEIWLIARLHINGCAIYKMTPTLYELLANMTKQIGFAAPFDMAIYQYLVNGENWAWTQFLFHKYVSHSFIQNRHSDLLTVSELQQKLPETFLVHHPWCSPPVDCSDSLGNDYSVPKTRSLKEIFHTRSYLNI